MTDADREEEIKDVLRKIGYPVPESEEETEALKRSMLFLRDMFKAKRSRLKTVKTGLLWGFTLSIVSGVVTFLMWLAEWLLVLMDHVGQVSDKQ